MIYKDSFNIRLEVFTEEFADSNHDSGALDVAEH